MLATMSGSPALPGVDAAKKYFSDTALTTMRSVWPEPARFSPAGPFPPYSLDDGQISGMFLVGQDGKLIPYNLIRVTTVIGQAILCESQTGGAFFDMLPGIIATQSNKSYASKNTIKRRTGLPTDLALDPRWPALITTDQQGVLNPFQIAQVVNGIPTEAISSLGVVVASRDFAMAEAYQTAFSPSPKQRRDIYTSDTLILPPKLSLDACVQALTSAEFATMQVHGCVTTTWEIDISSQYESNQQSASTDIWVCIPYTVNSAYMTSSNPGNGAGQSMAMLLSYNGNQPAAYGTTCIPLSAILAGINNGDGPSNNNAAWPSVTVPGYFYNNLEGPITILRSSGAFVGGSQTALNPYILTSSL